MRIKPQIVLVGLMIFITISINFAQSERAMWIWNNSNQVNNMINDIFTYRSDLFDFCASPHGDPEKKISVLFFSCREAVYSDSDNLRDFLTVSVDSGLTIEYLDGDPTWATYNQSDGYERIIKVVEFNENSASENEKIKGIQFDVEPYLLKADRGYQPPYWDTDRSEVWEAFINFLDTCQTMIDSSGDELYFGVAIPRWYENHVGIDELKRLQSIVDYVAIMDYNENYSVIIKDAENEIKHAEELNKKVWIGVETKEVSPETVSFAEEGVAYMEEQLDSVFKAYHNSPVFKGFAIHSYKYYKNLFYDPVSVKKNDNLISDFVLEQNYPNPFNPSTNIKFYMPEEAHVSLSVFNILGQKEIEIINEIRGKGWHNIIFTKKDLISGVYFYELQTEKYRLRKKMLVIK